MILLCKKIKIVAVDIEIKIGYVKIKIVGTLFKIISFIIPPAKLDIIHIVYTPNTSNLYFLATINPAELKVIIPTVFSA